MISIPLMVHRDGSNKLWGRYRFIDLPSPGDRVNITDDRGRVQKLRVMHVAHEPLRDDVADPSDRDLAWVHAEWLEEFY
ncbi:hypothetical protein FH063_002991 [Azospirillum argentinense]|uniref:Uncharacterized protein n=1 Tax=Azospirillum argentinense TaxID=2970906 RepID=A0A5B0KKA0_9PROT|nr:hypothetical protein FH063_002991 [Azospirillum argentinense]